MVFWSVLNTLRRKWWLIALATGLVTGVVFYLTWSAPQQWEGFATISESRSLSQRVVIYPDPMAYKADLITQLQNIANVLGSDTVLVSTWTDLKDSGRWRPADIIRQNFPARQQDYAGVFDLARRLEIKPVPNTEYLSVSLKVEGDSEDMADQARNAMETLLRKFEEQYKTLSDQGVRPQIQFIESQLKQAKRDLERAQTNLAEYLERNPNVIQTETNTSIMLNTIARVENTLSEAEVGQKAAAARLAQLEKQLSQGKAGTQLRKASEIVRTNPVRQQILTRLVDAETSLESLRGRGLGENHPDVLRAKSSVDELKKQLSGQTETILEAESRGTNSIYDAVMRDYLNTSAELDVQNKRVAALSVIAQRERSKLNGLPERQKIVEQLRLEKQLAQDQVVLMQKKLDEANVREQEQSGSRFIKRIDDARVRPVDKRMGLKVLLAFMLSLILSTGLVLLLAQLDQGVYTPTQAEGLLGHPVIAALPRMRRTLLPRDRADQTALGASYQMLSTSLLGANGKIKGPSIAITSAEPNVGRSTVAMNLAMTLARDGARVVLVDADMRQPSLHQLLRLENRVGLSEILSGDAEAEQVVQMTPVEGLVFISAGAPPENPIRLLRSPRMQELLQKLAAVADFVIIDTPAGITFADGSMTAMATNNVLVVHAAGSPVSNATKEFFKRMEHLGVNIVGVVLNKVRADDNAGFQHFQRSYRSTLALRNGYTASRPALTSGAEAEDQQPEQTSPRNDQ